MMMKLLKKISVVLGGLILGILYIFKGNKYRDNPESPLDTKKDKIEVDLKEVEKKEAKLKKDGVKELTDNETIDYWKDN